MKILAKDCLKERRMISGHSAKAMAERADMTYQGYWMVETGRRCVSPERSRLIVDAIGAEFEDVFELIDK